jgi:hypothetical protein
LVAGGEALAGGGSHSTTSGNRGNSTRSVGALSKQNGPSTKDFRISSKTSLQDYHLTFGTKFSQGICYKGKDHCHWSYSCWLPSCGCTCYYCPCTLVYYYWCAPDECWYPITYCPYGRFVF